MSPALLPRQGFYILQKAVCCTVAAPSLADMFQNHHNSSMLSFVIRNVNPENICCDRDTNMEVEAS